MALPRDAEGSAVVDVLGAAEPPGRALPGRATQRVQASSGGIFYRLVTWLCRVTQKQTALPLVDSLELLPIEPEIAEIVEAYIEHKVMPSDPLGDALHLALASYHKCDFLLTWNCRHLANANKFSHIKRINAILGLFVPTLITPLELLGGTENEG